MNPVTSSDPSTNKYCTQAEVQTALIALTEEDLAKLGRAAAFFWSQRHIHDGWGDPQDFLHEAIVQTLTGTKQWRRGVAFPYHLKRVIENISGHTAGREQRRSEKRSSELLPKGKESLRLGARRNPVEEGLIASDLLDEIRHYFGPDKEAFAFLCKRAEGMTESEAGVALGIEGAQLEAVARRARRKINTYKDQGGTL